MKVVAKKPTDLDDVLGVITDLTDMFSKRFDGVDAHLYRIDAKLGEHDKRFEKIEKQIDQLYGILDTHMKRMEEIMQDNMARDHQQARMERWIFQLADKLDVKLNYD